MGRVTYGAVLKAAAAASPLPEGAAVGAAGGPATDPGRCDGRIAPECCRSAATRRTRGSRWRCSWSCCAGRSPGPTATRAVALARPAAGAAPHDGDPGRAWRPAVARRRDRRARGGRRSRAARSTCPTTCGSGSRRPRRPPRRTRSRGAGRSRLGIRRDSTRDSPSPAIDDAVEHVRDLHRPPLVGDHDELRLVLVGPKEGQEALDVGVVERRLDLVKHIEGRWLGEHQREQEGDRGQRLLAAGEQRQRLDALAGRAHLELDPRLVSDLLRLLLRLPLLAFGGRPDRLGRDHLVGQAKTSASRRGRAWRWCPGSGPAPRSNVSAKRRSIVCVRSRIRLRSSRQRPLQVVALGDQLAGRAASPPRTPPRPAG